MKRRSMERFAVVMLMYVAFSIASPENKYKCFVQNKCEDENAPEMTSFVHKGRKYCCRGGDQLKYTIGSSKMNYLGMTLWSSGRVVSVNDNSVPVRQMKAPFVAPSTNPSSPNDPPNGNFDEFQKTSETLREDFKTPEAPSIAPSITLISPNGPPTENFDAFQKTLEPEPENHKTPGIDRAPVVADTVIQLDDRENSPESKTALAYRESQNRINKPVSAEEVDGTAMGILNTPSDPLKDKMPYHSIFKRDVSPHSSNDQIYADERTSPTDLAREFRQLLEENNDVRGPQLTPDSEFAAVNAGPENEPEKDNYDARGPQLTSGSESPDIDSGPYDDHDQDEDEDLLNAEKEIHDERFERVQGTSSNGEEEDDDGDVISCYCEAIDPTDTIFRQFLDNVMVSQFPNVFPAWAWPWTIPEPRRVQAYTNFLWFPQFAGPWWTPRD